MADRVRDHVGRFRTDLRALLNRAEAASPVEAIDVMADELAVMLDADELCFLIMDLSGRAVARFGGLGANAARQLEDGAEHAKVVPLPGTVYEKVLRSQRPDLRADGDDRHTLVVPVTDRGDTMGVIEMTVPWAPSERDVADVEECARALAYVVVGCRRHTDLFEWAQRSVPFSLAAEIQRRLLPAAFTCEAGQLTVSGWLEPANAVGGDTFDYSLDRDTLHVSITDAVGHDVHAAMLATLLVGSLRNGRRREQGLLEQAAAANDALAAYSGPGDFVTGQLVRINRHTARMSIVNAGHPFPYRVHEGRGRPRRSSRSTCRSACGPGGRSPTRRWSCAPATGSRSSPTASWSATRPPWKSPRCSPRPPTGTPERSFTPLGTKCSAPPAAIFVTTPRSCVSTGTAALSAVASPPR